jgi:hypothetical protein
MAHKRNPFWTAEMKMRSRAMKRAWRTAEAVKDGAAILEFISKPSSRVSLVARAKRGSPPVGAISTQLMEKFGANVKLTPVKLFIGTCVRAVLEEEGFRVAEKGVRLKNDEIFRTGSVYEPVVKDPPKSKDLFETMAASLSEADAVRAARILENFHPGVLRKARTAGL